MHCVGSSPPWYMGKVFDSFAAFRGQEWSPVMTLQKIEGWETCVTIIDRGARDHCRSLRV